MKKILSDKKNLVLLILLGVSLLTVIIATFVEVFMPISCIFFGISSIYGAYLMFLAYRKKRKTKLDEFVSEEETLKRRTTQFLQAESKVNLLLLVFMFAIIGVLLIYYGLKVFGL